MTAVRTVEVTQRAAQHTVNAPTTAYKSYAADLTYVSTQQ